MPQVSLLCIVYGIQGAQLPRGEPKVMFSVRLPGALRERIAERAQEDGVSEAELVADVLEEALDEKDRRAERT